MHDPIVGIVGAVLYYVLGTCNERLKAGNRLEFTPDCMAAGTRTAAANAEIESRCPICLEETQNAYRTECNHRFCGPCIKRALGIKKECPACRAPIASHRKLICEAEETRGAEWEQLMAWQPKMAQRLAHQLASSDGVKEALSNLPEGTVTAPQQQERIASACCGVALALWLPNGRAAGVVVGSTTGLYSICTFCREQRTTRRSRRKPRET